MKKKQIILSTCLGALLVVACVGIWLGLRGSKQTASNGNKLGVEWYHENGDEFVITTADELFELAKLSKYYDFAGQTIKLGADIIINEGNASDWEENMPEKVWSPIYGFAGTFDGQGHTISGLYGMGYFLAVLESVYTHAPKSPSSAGNDMTYLPNGLFAYTQEDCVIKDLNVTNSIFLNDVYTGCGSIVANGAGTLDAIYSDAIIVNYRRNAGGLVGIVENGAMNLTNCWYDGEIRMIGNDGRWSGGLVGNVASTLGTTTIKHCLNTADLTSEITRTDANAGGFVGQVSSGGKLKLEDSLSVGQLTAAPTRQSGVGTAIGAAIEGSTITVKKSYTNLDGYPASVGAIGGTFKSYPLELKGEWLVGEKALEWTNLDFKKHWTIVDGDTPMLREYADKVVDKTSAPKAYDISWYDKSKTEYTISTIEEFYGWYILSAENDLAGKAIKLGADLVINEGKAADWEKETPSISWFPIKQFAGTFDGQGHTISGVYLHTNQPGSGLICSTANTAVLKNFKLKNSYLANRGYAYAYFGGIVGRAQGVLDTIYSDAIITYSAVRSCGGLVGNVVGSDMTQITNCWFDGSLTVVGQTGGQAGGIAGRVESSAAVRITHCLNTATITSERKQGILLIGGFVGVGSSAMIEISDSLNVGKVEGPITDDVAAAISWIDDKTNISFENTYATSESSLQAVDTVRNTYTGGCMRIDEKYLTGNKAYQWTMLDFDKYWAVQKNGTPILQSFAENVPSVAGLTKKMDISWYKMRDKEYKIDTVAKLYGLTYLSYNTDFRNKTVFITKNLQVNAGNAADWATVAPANPWIPIHNFAGTFDGKGHTISGISLITTQPGAGLFGATTEKAVVKNFRLENSYFKHEGKLNAGMGSIVGHLSGEINTVYSNAIIEGDFLQYGGFTGFIYNHKAKIANSWFDGTINLSEKGGWAGGFVGHLQSTKPVSIEHCLSTGTVATKNTASPSIGGFVGLVYSTKNKVEITDCLSAGNVDTGTKTYVGLFAGFIDEKNTVKIKDTYATAYKNLKQIGSRKSEPDGWCYKVGANVITGLNGYRFTTLDFKNYWSAKENSTPVLKSFAGKGLNTSNVAKMVDKSWYKENKKVFELKDVQDLYGLAFLSQTMDFKDKTIKLANSIVMNEGMAAGFELNAPQNVWIPISSFSGTFDGQGHSIRGMYVKTEEQVGAMFAVTNPEATVKNLRLENSYFEHVGPEVAAMGSVIGQCAGLVDTIYSDAIVKGNSLLYGGIAAYIQKGATIKNCWYSGEMILGKKGGWAGGIVGEIYNGSEATIEHCLVTGTISSEYAEVPSIAGVCGIIEGKDTTVTIVDTLSSGKVIVPTTAGVGSLVGYLNTGSYLTINDTYVTHESHVNYLGGQKGTLTGAAHKRALNVLIGKNGYRMTTLDFEKYWVAVENGTPILKSFTTTGINLSGMARLIDTSWYDENQTVYELKDKEDLYGLAILSLGNDFKGKTFKLMNDIIFNEGNAKDWEIQAPENPWSPIQKFAGTFDGQGYSIKGLYLKAATDTCGLFSATTKDATLKNFRMENSYFEFAGPKNAGLGSIVGDLGGKLDSVYSDAIIKGDMLVYGGLAGSASKDAKITNCWFDGEMILGEKGAWIGGIIGAIQSNAKVTIEHCLNSGNIATKRKDTPSMGGICGTIDGKKTVVVVRDTLNTGLISAPTTSGVGSLIGFFNDGELVIEDTYVTLESHVNYIGPQKGKFTGAANKRTAEFLSGINGHRLTTLNFDNYWAAVEGSTPVLKSFAENTIDLTGVAKLFDISWYNDKDKVFELKDKEALYGLAILSIDNDFKGKTIRLMNDIDVNDVEDFANWSQVAPENPWLPISKFAGTFDGQGNTITGLYLKATTDTCGLFTTTTTDAILKDFRIEDSYFEFAGPKNAGLASIVGELGGTLDGVYSDAIIKGDMLVYGGLVASISKDATITNCWFDGEMILGEKGGWAGGIVGAIQDNAKVTIEHCLNSANITSGRADTPSIGGICGTIDGAETVVEVKDTLNTGVITVPTTSGVGSLIGYFNNGELNIEDTYVDVDSHVNYIGPQKGKVTGVANKRTKDFLVGVNGYRMTTLNFDKYWAAVENGTPVLKSFVENTIDLTGVSKLYDTSWLNEATGVVDDKTNDPYILEDKEDLYGLAILSIGNDFKGKTIILKNDIVINDVEDLANWSQVAPENPWAPIHKFAGTFDGQGHTISGLYMKASAQKSGLFAQTTESAIIRDFRLVDSYLESSQAYTGSIVGYFAGTIEKVYSDVDIKRTGGSRFGGIVGTVIGSARISECWFNGDINADVYVGGITGCIEAGANGDVLIEHCLYSGNIKCYDQAGGICGYVVSANNVTITDTLSMGTATYTMKSIGSFVGYIGDNVTLEKSVGNKSFYGNRCGNNTDLLNLAADCVTKDQSSCIGAAGASLNAYLDFDTYWVAKHNSTPVLKNLSDDFEDNYTVDGQGKKVYVIKNVADFYDFAILSQTNDFKDCIVKLDADITANEGVASASGWTTAEGKETVNWVQIGSTTTPFAGTFDGQGHSISGVYFKQNVQYAGLFAKTQASAHIKDFRLENSYFESNQPYFGSIFGSFAGKAERIYSNAIVNHTGSRSRIGGIAGTIQGGKATISECWFAGKVLTVSAMYVGGITGGMENGTSNDVIIEHCLYTGHVVAQQQVGGIVGYVTSGNNIKIKDTLSVGTVNYSKNPVGCFVGFVGADITIEDSVGNKAFNGNRCGPGNTGAINMVNVSSVIDNANYIGEKGLALDAYLDFDNYWVAKQNSTPELKNLTDETTNYMP